MEQTAIKEKKVSKYKSLGKRDNIDGTEIGRAHV